MSLEAGASLNQKKLNMLSPGARDAALGDCLNDLITQHNAFLKHVDAANVAGIGNTNFATYGITTLANRKPSPPGA